MIKSNGLPASRQLKLPGLLNNSTKTNISLPKKANPVSPGPSLRKAAPKLTLVWPGK